MLDGACRVIEEPLELGADANRVEAEDTTTTDVFGVSWVGGCTTTYVCQFRVLRRLCLN